jgi:FeS assembly SUF system protein
MSGPSPAALANLVDRIKAQDIEARVIEVLRTLYDPEIPVNIYDLGLIYDVNASPDGNVIIRMTLTSPMCPVAGSLPGDVKKRVEEADGVTQATVEVVWDPPWTMDQLSEAARLQLGLA